ncbi:hypothetical protein [Falsiroseomonas oryziterrae]|uniref:hypothetical protein n=1 Tax=Falsiroseomonas oryziterrae TaxID=2911368 RepID=UPI001F422B49|nr:hypothetical protein [Roseomonas sp. NPKOSM-4]
MRIPAFIHLPGDAIATPDATGRLARLAALALRVVRVRREERQLLEQVAQMDDATLRDIGTNRWELRAHIRSGRVTRADWVKAWRGAA